MIGDGGGGVEIQGSGSRDAIPSRQPTPERVENPLHYVLYGTKPDPETRLVAAANLDASLDRVLAVRPRQEHIIVVSELDKTLSSVHTPVDPRKVKEIDKTIKDKGLEWWNLADDLPTNEDFYYTEQFAPYFQQGMQIGAPEKVVANQEVMRKMLNNARASVAAAEVVTSQLPEDVSEADRKQVQEWQENRTRLLSSLVRAYGVERTAMVFNNPQANTDLKTNFDFLLQQLDFKSAGQLQPPLEQVVMRMNDFVRQNFWWIEEFGSAYVASHSKPVAEAASPLLSIAEEWIKRPEYQNRAILEGAFDAAAALIRLREVSHTLPVEQQSAFRKEAVGEIRKAWINQLVTGIKQLREAYEGLATTQTVTAGQKVLEQRVKVLTTSLHLTPAQRHEVARSAALLAQRTVNIREFAQRHFTETGLAEMARICFGFVPKEGFLILPGSTSVEFIFKSDEDFDKAYGLEAKAAGFAGIKVDELGREIPVTVFRQSQWKPEVEKHERAHILYSSNPASQRQAFHKSYFDEYSGSASYNTDHPEARVKRLGLLNKYQGLRWMQDEIVAHMFEGRDQANMDAWLNRSELYDFHRFTPELLGLTGGSDNFGQIDSARNVLRQKVKKGIEAAFAIKEGLSLSNEDCAMLLAVLPMNQWHHITNILKRI